jgi:protein-L-isoaspartate(D-aspartate) O-methyltransferase
MDAEGMIAAVLEDVRETRAHLGKDALEARVMAALRDVPRHEFVPAEQQARAYENVALPIGFGQTISQPYVVAVMTDMLALAPEHDVLEIGTGCGYQTGILAKLARRVFSVELVTDLADAARERLARLGIANVQIRTGDGREGWPENAPYDAIIVTAAAREIPEPLVAQLKPGGRMVIPVGDSMLGQQLTLVERDSSGHIARRTILPVAFVPLVRARKR